MFSKLLKRNEFAKNTLTLMIGTVLAQTIPIAIIPILTRIFTPEDFGLLALYGAFVSVLGVVATGRYEIAIMLPKEDEDARALLQISALVAFTIALALMFPVVLWNSEIATFLGNPQIAPWLYLVPASVFFTGVYQALTYWNNRQKKFKNTAASRVLQSMSQVAGQTSFGFLKLMGGLIWGQFLGILSGLFFLFFKNKTYKQVFGFKNRVDIKKQALLYQKFPKYGIAGSLCDAAAMYMPVFMLTKFYSSSITGMFSLTFRVLNIPTIIISSAIAQVLFQKVVEISHSSPQHLKAYITKLFFMLFVLYLPAVPILIFFGEDLFALVFGEQWREAGTFASFLAVAVAIRFAVSPLSSVLGLEQNIKLGVAWQVLYLCTITTTLLLCAKLPVAQFIAAFVIHEVALYLIYLALILKGAKAVALTN